MRLYVGKRVQHWKSKRQGVVVQLPSTNQAPENQTHMKIQYFSPAGDWPKWRRISAYENVTEEKKATMEAPEALCVDASDASHY